jgi:hypothetical protein
VMGQQRRQLSIELDNAAEGAHGHRDVGSCSSL